MCSFYLCEATHDLISETRKKVRNCLIILSVFIQIYYSETRCTIGNRTQPKVWVCDCSLAGTAGLNRAGCMNVFIMCVVCCEVEVPATGRSLGQRSCTEYSVSEGDLEASTMRRPWSARAVEPLKNRYYKIMSLPN